MSEAIADIKQILGRLHVHFSTTVCCFVLKEIHSHTAETNAAWELGINMQGTAHLTGDQVSKRRYI
jgi:hypothetical protein